MRPINSQTILYRGWHRQDNWIRRRILFFPVKYICIFNDKVMKKYKNVFFIRYIEDGDVIHRSITHIWGPIWREFSTPLYGEDEFGIKWENCEFLQIGRW